MNGRLAISIVGDTTTRMLRVEVKKTPNQPTRTMISKTARTTRKTPRMTVKSLSKETRISKRTPNPSRNTKNFAKSTASKRSPC
jgi:hypothetical protein